jgi:hypothetical protein
LLPMPGSFFSSSINRAMGSANFDIFHLKSGPRIDKDQHVRVIRLALR